MMKTFSPAIETNYNKIYKFDNHYNIAINKSGFCHEGKLNLWTATIYHQDPSIRSKIIQDCTWVEILRLLEEIDNLPKPISKQYIKNSAFYLIFSIFIMVNIAILLYYMVH